MRWLTQFDKDSNQSDEVKNNGKSASCYSLQSVICSMKMLQSVHLLLKRLAD